MEKKVAVVRIGGSMHLIDLKNFLGSTAIVSNSIPVGVGYAYSLKYFKNNSRICIYIGDASCEEEYFLSLWILQY